MKNETKQKINELNDPKKVPYMSSIIYDGDKVFIRKVALCGDAGSIKYNGKIRNVSRIKWNGYVPVWMLI